jgi:hypothetical protein
VRGGHHRVDQQHQDGLLGVVDDTQQPGWTGRRVGQQR